MEMRLKDESGRFTIEVSELRGIGQRMKGLIGADGLPRGKGVLIRTRHIHTFGVRFSIDAVYLSKDGTVKKLVTLPPRRLGPLVGGSRAVLELRQDEARRLGIEVGTKLLEERCC